MEMMDLDGRNYMPFLYNKVARADQPCCWCMACATRSVKVLAGDLDPTSVPQIRMPALTEGNHLR
jgi:hypothetical protein